jgi:hypothetical protein
MGFSLWDTGRERLEIKLSLCYHWLIAFGWRGCESLPAKILIGLLVTFIALSIVALQ